MRSRVDRSCRRSAALLLLSGTVACAPLAAQQLSVTAADYARAERAMAGPGAAIGGTVAPNWLPDGRFWYRSVTATGTIFLLVDPVKKTRVPVFEHLRLAAALSKASGTAYDVNALPFQTIDLSANGRSVAFNVGDKRWSCDVKGTKCTAVGAATAEAAPAGGRGGRGAGAGGRGGRGGGAPAEVSSKNEPLNLSPDGKRGVFIRDWNLWVRDLATGQERQLTHDGIKYFGYATDNAGWSGSDRAMVAWSPDSKKVATQQQDERNVGEMYLVGVPTGPPYSDRFAGHPALRVTKFPLPGDSVMAMIHRVIVDVDAGTVLRLKMPPDFHRGTREDNIEMNDYKWSPDGSTLVLASMSRDNKHVWITAANAATGDVRRVLDETQATQFQSKTGWQVLWPTNEILWFSERDNWGQLYLYDLATGQLKNKITTGDGPVTAVTRLDEKTRTLWYAANGREPGQNPYYSHFYRVSLDGSHNVSLTPGDGTHTMQLSPDGRYVIDTYSKTDVPPVTELRDGVTGALILPLEKADISRLLATGWKPVQTIKMTAHDGKTDIYGLMFTPQHVDSNRKYPIINHIYPGPQTGSVGGGWGFRTNGGEPQGLAELGFVVVEINGMGTPGRSKAFQDAYYGAMGRDNTLPDQITGMKQLADRYRFIDIDQVGIYGHSGGGFATGDAMFRYPDFFKVGIAESGNHDQRENEDDWGERYQGLVVRNADGTDNYDPEANERLAGNLKGHLLLAHGTWDTNVPPPETFLMVDALIKANKDFDLLLIPNSNHAYGAASQYMQRRRWDYFVRWLLNTEPPKEYQFAPAGSGRGGRGGGE